MAAFLAAKFEVWAETAVVQHVEGVAAYRKDLADAAFVSRGVLGAVGGAIGRLSALQGGADDHGDTHQPRDE